MYALPAESRARLWVSVPSLPEPPRYELYRSCDPSAENFATIMSTPPLYVRSYAPVVVGKSVELVVLTTTGRSCASTRIDGAPPSFAAPQRFFAHIHYKPYHF